MVAITLSKPDLLRQYPPTMYDPPNDSLTPALLPRQVWLRRLPLILMLAAAVLGAILLRDHLNFETLARHQADLMAFRNDHYLWAALGFTLAYVGVVCFGLPGATIMTLTGGFLFGLGPGVAFNVLAAGSGAVLVFLVARAGAGADLATRLARSEGPMARLAARMVDNEWSVLFLIRLVPVVPFFLANLLPAMIGTRLWRYALTTYLGIFPGALVYTSVGSGLGEVFARGEVPNLSLFTQPEILLPLLGLAGLAALPILLRIFRKGP